MQTATAAAAAAAKRKVVVDNRSNKEESSLGNRSSKEESGLGYSLGSFWQCILVVGTLPYPTCSIAYAVSKNSFYLSAAIAFDVVSWCCLLLMVVADPSNRKITNRLKLYWVAYFAVNYGCRGWGRMLDSHDPSLFWAIGNFVGVAISIALLPLFFKMRERIGALPKEQLHYYMKNVVFLQGFGAIPPIFYLSIQSLQCISDNSDYIGHFDDVCGGVTSPAFSICGMMGAFLFARLYLAPLTSSTITIEQLLAFKGLNLKDKANFALGGLAGMCNFVLFALMGPGPRSTTIGTLLVISFLSLFIIALIEMFTILRKKNDNDDDRSDSVAWSTNTMIDQVTGSMSNMV